MTWLIVQFVIGVLVLTKAADWFARGAGQLAELSGLPRLLLAALLVGFVTNLPEFAISSMAAWMDRPGIALGNPIGSIIVNTGLVLGILLAGASQIKIDPAWMRYHSLPMLLACLALYVVALWSDVTRPMALLLLLLCGGYVYWSIACARRDPASLGVEGLELDGRHNWATVTALLAISIPLVVISSRWVLATSVSIAYELQVTETVIALTLVALGTSLPELATALAAARRGHHDTSVGLILGSNIYNALGVIGLGGLIATLPVSLANRLFDLPVMLLVVMVALLPFALGRMPGRRTGLALLAIYGVYTYSLFTLYGIFT